MAEKSGPILGLVGGLMLAALNLIAFQFLPWYAPPPSNIAVAYFLNFIFTFIWVAITVTGAILAIRDIFIGKYIMLAGGLLILIGKMIPIAYCPYSCFQILNFVPLNRSFWFVDAILIIVGGVTAIAKKEEVAPM
ncbi:MAG: hypothetical protein ACFE8E_04300 [Candidatus Hodarchaeota archaeon]